MQYYILLFLLTSTMPRITRQSVAAGKSLEDNLISESADKDDIPTSSVVPSTLEIISSTSFEIPYLKKNIFCTSFGSDTNLSLIFTQGAGGDLSSAAVTNFAEGFSQLKKVICFLGRSNLQWRTGMFKTVIEHHHCNVLGGRSMGARAAIATAKEIANVKALILVSYPLRGHNGDLRDQLLLDIDKGIDVLFVIGDRDSMCDLNELRSVIRQ